MVLWCFLCFSVLVMLLPAFPCVWYCCFLSCFLCFFSFFWSSPPKKNTHKKKYCSENVMSAFLQFLPTWFRTLSFAWHVNPSSRLIVCLACWCLLFTISITVAFSCFRSMLERWSRRGETNFFRNRFPDPRTKRGVKNSVPTDHLWVIKINPEPDRSDRPDHLGSLDQQRHNVLNQLLRPR